MKRSLGVLLCLLTACAVLSAPAPPVFFKPGWDAPVDPDKDCKIRQTEEQLAIELPGKAHDFDRGGKLRNAPRLLRDVKGDFRVDVRVSGDWACSAESTLSGEPVYAGGGLLVLMGDKMKNVLRLEFGTTNQEKWGPYACYRTFYEETGGGGNMFRNPRSRDGWPLMGGAKYMYLRLESRDNIVRAYYSADGKEWVDYQPGLTIGLPTTAKPKVGLAAFSTSKVPCKVYFDQFNLVSLRMER